jgi:hypothetical protein
VRDVACGRLASRSERVGGLVDAGPFCKAVACG